MKIALQNLFEFMGNPENFRLSVLIMLGFCLASIAIGLGISAGIYWLLTRKKPVQEYYFHDGIQQPMRIVRRKQNK